MSALSSKRTHDLNTTQQADVFGVLCSLGCAIHCAATPLMLTVLPSVTTMRVLADPLFHQAVAMVCGILVVRAILPGFRSHRSKLVLSAAAIGLFCLFAAAFVLPEECCDTPSTHKLAIAPAEYQQDWRAIDDPNRSTDLHTTLKPEAALPSGQDSIDENVAADSNTSRQVSASNFLANQSNAVHRFRLVSSIKPEAGRTLPDAPSTDAFPADQQSNLLPTTMHPSRAHIGGLDPAGSRNSTESGSWGRTLLDDAALKATFNESGAAWLSWLQPYLTPIGGSLLDFAHVLNIFHGRCRHDCHQ